jgi:membrane protease subunit HflK
VLTTGKNEIQSNIKQMIIDKLEVYDIGIQLVNITIQDAEPPTDDVSMAFKEVETAKQGKETSVNNANKYRNEEIPAAEAAGVVAKAAGVEVKRVHACVQPTLKPLTTSPRCFPAGSSSFTLTIMWM